MNVATMLVCLPGSMLLAQKDDVVFKAPLIEVRKARLDNREYHYVLYNRVYLGRNYLKPMNQADYGKPDADFSRLPTTYFHDKSPIARDEKYLAHLKAPAYEGNEGLSKIDYWSPPWRTDRKFAWTDRGEQSFRGFYYSDPEIDKVLDVVNDAQAYLRASGVLSDIQLYKLGNPIHELIRAWSAASARSKNGGSLPWERLRRDAKEDRVAFEAPLVRVNRDRTDKNEYLSLMFNGIYLGKNYQKPKDHKSYGDPETDLSRYPTTYFHNKSPMGILLQKFNWFPGKENTYHADARLAASLVGLGLAPAGQLAHLWSEPPIAVVGMDVGTLASYARPAQTLHFVEWMPAFVTLSVPGKGEKPLFSYVQDALDRGACVKVFEGEPRASFEKLGNDGFYQLIVVNTYKLAVSTVHEKLMTTEGMKLLMSKTRPDGIVSTRQIGITISILFLLAPPRPSATRSWLDKIGRPGTRSAAAIGSPRNG